MSLTPPCLPLNNDSPAIEALTANGAFHCDAPNTAADQPQTQNSHSMLQTRPRRPLTLGARACLVSNLLRRSEQGLYLVLRPQARTEY